MVVPLPTSVDIMMATETAARLAAAESRDTDQAKNLAKNVAKTPEKKSKHAARTNSRTSHVASRSGRDQGRSPWGGNAYAAYGRWF